VGFANSRNENARLLVLAVAVAVLEIVVLPRVMFGLLKIAAQWSPPLQMLVLMIPRLAIAAVLVAALGPFRQGLWFSVFLVLYTVVLLVRFNQTEIYVNWDSAIAVGRATLPYLAGLAGAVLGFWSRHRGATLRRDASEKPSVHA
jgi:hypothetical protein